MKEEIDHELLAAIENQECFVLNYPMNAVRDLHKLPLTTETEVHRRRAELLASQPKTGFWLRGRR